MATADGDPVLKDAKWSRKDGVFTATVEWELKIVITANLLDMLPVAAANAHIGKLPLEGNRFPGYELATCRSIECKNTDTNGIYRFVAKYSDENASETEQQTNDNPLKDLPIVKPMAGMTTRAITKDRDGNAILNSANDPIKQSMDDNTIGFKVSANVASVPQWILTFRNTCNDAPITVGGLLIDTNMARFILPSDWLSERKNRNGIWYYVFQFELKIDERDRHYGTPLDAGFHQLVFDDNFNRVKEAIVRKDGSEPNEPVPLEAGTGEVLEDPTPDTVNFLNVKKYPEADYSVLPGVS